MPRSVCVYVGVCVCVCVFVFLLFSISPKASFLVKNIVRILNGEEDMKVHDSTVTCSVLSFLSVKSLSQLGSSSRTSFAEHFQFAN